MCKGSGAMGKRRLDTLLAERGLFSSRSRAAASVMAGEVRLGAGERRAAKPGELVDVDERVRVVERPSFVSRGGIKLANALAYGSTTAITNLVARISASQAAQPAEHCRYGPKDFTPIDQSANFSRPEKCILGFLPRGSE